MNPVKNHDCWGLLKLEKPSSYFREELSIAFSEDDGRTWTNPLVFARGGDERVNGSRFTVQYPKVVEPEPGLLWIYMGHTGGRYTWVSVRESNLLAAETAVRK